MSKDNGWIGVDLDGTLAYYDHWRGVDHIGEPVPKMLERVKFWLQDGIDVRIMTARVSGDDWDVATMIIQRWLNQHGLPTLAVTCQKDFAMIELWDDRCVQVIPNTGIAIVVRPKEKTND